MYVSFRRHPLFLWEVERQEMPFILLCLPLHLPFCEILPAAQCLGRPTATGSPSSSKWTALFLLILTQTGDLVLTAEGVMAFAAEDASMVSYL